MSKESREAEIERICNIAVAAENTRLANGGDGPGDRIVDPLAIQHDGQKYAVARPVVASSQEPSTIGYLEADGERDEYRKLIEAPAVETEPEAVALVHGDIRRMTMEHVDEIRSRVASMPTDHRSDVGYLLEVIDAYKSGRM